jgi:hypothetical protein
MKAAMADPGSQQRMEKDMVDAVAEIMAAALPDPHGD